MRITTESFDWTTDEYVKISKCQQNAPLFEQLITVCVQSKDEDVGFDVIENCEMKMEKRTWSSGMQNCYRWFSWYYRSRMSLKSILQKASRTDASIHTINRPSLGWKSLIKMFRKTIDWTNRRATLLDHTDTHTLAKHRPRRNYRKNGIKILIDSNPSLCNILRNAAFDEHTPKSKPSKCLICRRHWMCGRIWIADAAQWVGIVNGIVLQTRVNVDAVQMDFAFKLTIRTERLSRSHWWNACQSVINLLHSTDRHRIWSNADYIPCHT